MKTTILIALFTLFISTMGFAQTKFPVEFRVEKQAMSTPMSALEEVLFMNYFYARPVNIKFDGSLLNVSYDNGSTVVKKKVTEVNRNEEYEGNKLSLETILYTDVDNASDTISYVVDHSVGYVQIILPAKNTKGDYVGYTSYMKFVKGNELALN